MVSTMGVLLAAAVIAAIAVAEPAAGGAEAKQLAFVEGGAIQAPRSPTAGETLRLENADPPLAFEEVGPRGLAR